MNKEKSSRKLAKRVIVAGAGVAGLFLAGVLAEFFEQVILLEKDRLPEDAIPRKGIPQGEHGHVMLAYGEKVAEQIFPGYREAMARGGAFRMTVGLDNRIFLGGSWNPVRELDDPELTVFSSSRFLIDNVLRSRVSQLANVDIRECCRFLRFELRKGANVSQAVVAGPSGSEEKLAADLFIDCSGRGSTTPHWLKAEGFGSVPKNELGIDVGYTTGIFEHPGKWPYKGKMLLYGSIPTEVDGILVLPIENGREQVTLVGRFGDFPPRNLAGFRAFASRLEDPAIPAFLNDAKLTGPLRSYRMKASLWRHYDRMERFPEGFLPMGDTVTNFNPVFGQGMSVAAHHAATLRTVLSERAGEGSSLQGLARDVLERIIPVNTYVWRGAEVMDLRHEKTTGERPPDLEKRRAFGWAISRLIHEDDELYRMSIRVRHLLDPPTLFQQPHIVSRVTALLSA